MNETERKDSEALISKACDAIANYEFGCTKDLPLFKKCVADGLDMKYTTATGLTWLHLAAWWGRLDVCKYLVEEQNMDIDEEDEYGDSPYITAVKKGDTDIVEYFESIKSKSPCGDAELMYHAEIINYLDSIKAKED